MAVLLSSLRTQGASMIACMVFGALFYSLHFLLPLTLETNLMFMTIVDLVLAFTFKSKIFKENRKE